MIQVASCAPAFLIVIGMLLGGCDQTSSQSELPLATLSEEGHRQLVRAEQLLGAGQTGDVLTIAKTLTMEAPGDWRSHELLARACMQRALSQQGQGLIEQSNKAFGETVAAYAVATERAGTIGGLYRSAADAAQMSGQSDQARAWYERAMELEPTDPRSPLRLAQVVFERDPEAARRLLERVLTLDASIPEAHASLALLDAQQGDVQAARGRMRTAVDLATDVVAIRIVQARMHRVLGEPRRGVEILLALPSVDRAAEPTATELARCWAAIGQHSRAADAWAACFHAMAHRSDAWRFALEAAKSSLRAGERPRAAGFLDQAVYLSAPPDLIKAARKTKEG
jgi:tetratricopeptide (TPR) repeat protein